VLALGPCAVSRLVVIEVLVSLGPCAVTALVVIESSAWPVRPHRARSCWVSRVFATARRQ
jgi:hypothetical protein